jgi:hypothetical protein
MAAAWPTSGVKVLELRPDDAFRPDFWRLSSKLGLVYGFLGCSVSGGRDEARLVPDAARFEALFNTLEAYQA